MERSPRPAVLKPVPATHVRCPFCHDAVAVTHGLECPRCAARCHAACGEEAGQCATCGEDLREELGRRALALAELAAGPRWLGQRHPHLDYPLLLAAWAVALMTLLKLCWDAAFKAA